MNDYTTDRARSGVARSGREITLLVISGFVAIIGFFFLNSVGQYALVGRHPFQFFADSGTYHDLYSGFLVGPEGFIDVSYNFLGPMLLLSLARGNIYLVMLANIALFCVSIIAISRALRLDPVKAALFQFLSPMTLSSLMSVNKEIIAFPVLAFLICGYKQRSIPLVIAAVLISILARWQLTVFCLILIGIYIVRDLNRYIIAGALLFSISFAYFLSQDILRPVLENVEVSTAAYTEGSGLFERLIEQQNDGFYFIVAPIKAAHLMFSLGFRIDSMVNPQIVYNDQIVATYCLMNLIFLALIVWKRQAVLSNDIIMISVVYLIVFALTPVYAPRYFYPVTVLWALVLAGANGRIVQVERKPDRLAWGG